MSHIDKKILDQEIVNTCQTGWGLWINYFYLYYLKSLSYRSYDWVILIKAL